MDAATDFPFGKLKFQMYLHTACTFNLIIFLSSASLPAHLTVITQSAQDGCSNYSLATPCMPYNHVGHPPHILMVSCIIPAHVQTIYGGFLPPFPSSLASQ